LTNFRILSLADLADNLQQSDQHKTPTAIKVRFLKINFNPTPDKTYWVGLLKWFFVNSVSKKNTYLSC